MAEVNVAEALRQYFDSQGLTQQNVADKLGVSQSAVNQYLTGKSKFGKSTARKWNELFGFSRGWLLTGEGPMFENTSPVQQTINNNSGVAIQQAGSINTATPSAAETEGYFTRLCQDLLKQIMERDQKICCLEDENRQLRDKLNGTR